MQLWQIKIGAMLLVALFCVESFGAPFVVFPKAGELRSPDGRFVVRNADREAASSEIAGVFHSLWLVELATERSRKLCDYVGLAAVAWSGNDFLVVTQYLAKRTSRALVFSVVDLDDPVILDKPTLTHLVPVELRPALRENDHVFVEAMRVGDAKLHLTVWGYGSHDANGFHWNCEYALREGTVSCAVQDRTK